MNIPGYTYGVNLKTMRRFTSLCVNNGDPISLLFVKKTFRISYRRKINLIYINEENIEPSSNSNVLQIHFFSSML
jgi:hypothetical protein